MNIASLTRFRLRTAAILLATFAIALVGCGQKESTTTSPSGATSGTAAGGKPVIAMLPKLINIDYFDACKRGASKAAEELGVTLDLRRAHRAERRGAKQVHRHLDSPEGERDLHRAESAQDHQRFVEKAQAAGIKVLTWDSDAPESGRDLFVNQVDEKTLGEALDGRPGAADGRGRRVGHRHRQPRRREPQHLAPLSPKRARRRNIRSSNSSRPK